MVRPVKDDVPLEEAFPIEQMEAAEETQRTPLEQEWHEINENLDVVLKVSEYVGMGVSFLICIIPLGICTLARWEWSEFPERLTSCLHVGEVVGKVFGYVAAVPVVPFCRLVKWMGIGAIYAGAWIFGTAKESMSYDAEF